MVLLVPLIDTEWAHAPNELNPSGKGWVQSEKRTERNAVLLTALGAQAESQYERTLYQRKQLKIEKSWFSRAFNLLNIQMLKYMNYE